MSSTVFCRTSCRHSRLFLSSPIHGHSETMPAKDGLLSPRHVPGCPCARGGLQFVCPRHPGNFRMSLHWRAAFSKVSWASLDHPGMSLRKRLLGIPGPWDVPIGEGWLQNAKYPGQSQDVPSLCPFTTRSLNTEYLRTILGCPSTWCTYVHYI